MQGKHFTEEEFPFENLSRFGLTAEKVLDLPQSVLKRLSKGGVSPVLPIRFKSDAGPEFETRARIRFVREDNGSVGVIFSPQIHKADLSRFTVAEKKTLENGDPVFGSMPGTNGGMIDVVFQIDGETNQVMYVPKAVIVSNIALLKDKYRLTPAEQNCLLNGSPLTIYPNDKPKTMGIDLNDDNGLRIEDNEEDEWRENSRREWSKYEFGINGCWVMDENGNLDYVHEDDYTDELWNEQKKAAQRNAQAHSRR